MREEIKVGFMLLGAFVIGEVYGRTSSRLKAEKKLWDLKTKTAKANGENVWAEDLAKDITTWMRDPDDPRNSKEFVGEVIGRFSDELRKRLKDPEEVIDVEDVPPDSVDQVQIKEGRVKFEGED